MCHVYVNVIPIVSSWLVSGCSCQNYVLYCSEKKCRDEFWEAIIQVCLCEIVIRDIRSLEIKDLYQVILTDKVFSRFFLKCEVQFDVLSSDKSEEGVF